MWGSVNASRRRRATTEVVATKLKQPTPKHTDRMNSPHTTAPCPAPPSPTAHSPTPERRAALCLLTLSLLLLGQGPARASTAWGSINNFDCVNDTGVECHGFEIEIEDIHSQDIGYTYSWNHYGTPRITEDNSNPVLPRIRVRYESARTTNGTWAAYTAIPSGPIAPTDGHRFTDPSVNFGGEHFGVGFRGAATNITYFWLVDDGTGQLVRGPAVVIATPTFSYYPPAGGGMARVQAEIEPPPEPHVREFGTPSWVKEIRTTTHNNREVKLRDLVSDDPDDPDDKNWRNGEPDEVEVEWQLLQTEFRKADGGRNGHLQGKAEDLPHGDEVVTRRYEFYKYIGPVDAETGEALAEKVGPDGIHGFGTNKINGVDVDLSTLEVVGEYLGAQMSAFDVDASVGLIDHVQDGVRDEVYPTRTLVITGSAQVAVTNWGNLPPGLSFDRDWGELSGTPSSDGEFQFTVEARVSTNPPVRKTYTLTIAPSAAAAAALPARSTVDTLPAPIEGGSTSGDGSYTNDTTATVTAAPAPGFSFVNWMDNGKVVSASLSYTFTNIINRSLVANFVPAPTLTHRVVAPGVLSLSWPTNFAGFVLEQNANLGTTNWVRVTNGVSVLGSNQQVFLAPLTGNGFFRLVRP